VQERQPLGHKFMEENIDAGHIAARPGKAGNQPQTDGVFADDKDNRDCRGRSFGCKRTALTSAAITATRRPTRSAINIGSRSY